MTETFSAVWDNRDLPYLKPVYDGPGSEAPGHRLPLSVEVNAEDWIASTPVAYCGVATAELLEQILPGFDQETRDFYRWQVDYTQEELSEILLARTGIDFGRVHSLVALERGESGRIIKLRIVGEKRTVVIGKELEIRRALSRSHLYSSAFVIRATRSDLSDYPERFSLIGAGWGHGVGLCQIGAAVMERYSLTISRARRSQSSIEFVIATLACVYADNSQVALGPPADVRSFIHNRSVI
jgi:peptidoglycan hydrolase-like amidase